MPQYKLTYFNGKGRGELIRFIFKAAGVDFEDHRLERQDWPKIKPTLPFGQVPILEVDGQILPQSISIARYLARELGLAGKTSWDIARADAAVDAIADMGKEFMVFLFEKDPVKKAAATKNFAENVAPDHLKNIQAFLELNNEGDGYFVGQSLTWADLFLAVTMGFMVCEIDDLLKPYPKLDTLYNKVNNVPQIAAWIKDRPVTPF